MPVLCGIEGVFIEPKWLRVRRLVLSEEPTVRIAHFTDLHYRGDKAYLDEIADEASGDGYDAILAGDSPGT